MKFGWQLKVHTDNNRTTVHIKCHDAHVWPPLVSKTLGMMVGRVFVETRTSTTTHRGHNYFTLQLNIGLIGTKDTNQKSVICLLTSSSNMHHGMLSHGEDL